MRLQLGLTVCKTTKFEVLDCGVEAILGIPFIKQLNLEIGWTTGVTTIDGYTIRSVDHEAYTNNLRLEIVSSKALVKGLQQGNYTWCGYMDSM